MKTFYAVTDGDYSDYHIVAITDNKERAENIKKLYTKSYSEPMIEEFFDGEAKDEMLYCVEHRIDGSYCAKPQDFGMCNFADVNVVHECICTSDWLEYLVDVFAKDENHAIKIAQDLWAEYKAKKEGIV